MPPRFSGVGSSRWDNREGELRWVYRGPCLTVGEVDVRFIALLSPFDPTQERFRGEKAGSSRLKCHFDSEAWVPPGTTWGDPGGVCEIET